MTWHDAGFSEALARAWQDAGADLDTAVALRETGLSLFEAAWPIAHTPGEPSMPLAYWVRVGELSPGDAMALVASRRRNAPRACWRCAGPLAAAEHSVHPAMCGACAPDAGYAAFLDAVGFGRPPQATAATRHLMHERGPLRADTNGET